MAWKPDHGSNRRNKIDHGKGVDYAAFVVRVLLSSKRAVRLMIEIPWMYMHVVYNARRIQVRPKMDMFREP